jgi:hypothetical protein
MHDRWAAATSPHDRQEHHDPRADFISITSTLDSIGNFTTSPDFREACYDGFQSLVKA